MENKNFYNFISLTLSILFMKNTKNKNVNGILHNINDKVYYLKNNAFFVLNSIVTDKNKKIVKNSAYNVYNNVKSISKNIFL